MTFKPMVRHEFGIEDDFTLLEGTSEELVELYQNMSPNSFYTVGYYVTKGTQRMQGYIDKLKQAGLDIGKGDATFGYKMPLPEKNSNQREFIIFRRK